MKSTIKKCLVVAVAALLVITSVFATFAAGNDITIDGNSMSNGYIKITCDYGDLRMKTTGGDPDNANDDDKLLLFNENIATSQTTFNIDGEVLEYFSDDGIFDAASKSYASSSQYNKISVKHTYSFITSDATGRDDLVEIKYILTNNDTVAHDCGVRIMLDTMLGDNDDAPFRIPGVGATTTERTFYGANIPEYFQTFDDLENPSVVSYGFFDKTSSNKADFVQFINYWKSEELAWDITTEDGANIGDSSVVSAWDVKTLNPGETRTYKMYYGLGKFVADTSGELQLGGYGANRATVNEDATGYETSVVTAYVKNASDKTLNNVTVTLNTATGMTLADGELTVNLGDFAPGEEKQFSWNVNFAPVNVEKTIIYSITADADNAEPVTVTLSTILPALDVEVPEEPTEAPTEAPTQEPTEAPTEAPTQEITEEETKVPSPATKDQSSTSDTKKPVNNNTIKTGSTVAAGVFLTVLVIVAGVIMFTRKRKGLNNF